MFELILLIAIAYAGARGVEKVTGTSARRYDTDESRKAVEKVAASGPAGKPAKTAKAPGPTQPGGTFSAAAPRSAKIGEKAAAPIAVIIESGSTMWKAVGEGYRERWPEIREEQRRKMTEKAQARRKKKEAAEAKKKAEDAAAKAGPPPPYPPMPTDPPKTAGSDTQGDGPDPKNGTETPKPPDQEAKPAPVPAGTGTAPQVAGWPGDGTAYLERQLRKDEDLRATAEATTGEPAPATEPEQPAVRPRLSVVPNPAQNGDLMSSPNTLIPEIRTLDSLMNALILTKAMCEMRAEEAEAIAADDLTLSNRLDQIEAELAELEVDAATRQEIDALRESIHTQSQAAAQYGAAAKDSGDFATVAAASAYKSHGGIAEAVQSSPVESAALAGYYEH